MNATKKRLLLVDASSYLYRAFHALPEFRSPAGEPTGAILGVVNMLRKLKQDFPSDYIAAVFDPKGKTFRDDIYPQYKATRQAMPEDLAAQVAPLLETVRALGWPVVIVDGVEADDVIGTLVRHAEQAHGWDSVISTGDKDLTQLVSDKVLWVNTMSNEKLDRAGVKAKFGVPPERIIDYLALMGDAADNVPGVSKVVPKTAASSPSSPPPCRADTSRPSSPRAATRPCSTRHRSSAGRRRSRPRRSRASTPKPPASTLWSPSWSAFPSRRRPARRRTSRSPTATPAGRSSLRPSWSSNACGHGSRTRASSRSGRTPSTTATCSRTTASWWVASRTIRCSSPTSSKATSATTWTRSRRAISARPASSAMPTC